MVSKLTAFAAGLFVALVIPVVAQDYRLQPGDTVAIEVREDPSLNRELLVAPDGSITFPPVGQVRAGGRTLPQIEAFLVSALGPNFAGDPTVFVSLRTLRPPYVPDMLEPEETITVFVTGEMNAPGALEIAPRATLLQLIAAAGGPTRFAAMNRVQLRRLDPRSGDEQVFRIDAEALLEGRGSASEFRVREGDVLIVPERRLFE
jgi:polysaccharide export outer membrane protein